MWKMVKKEDQAPNQGLAMANQTKHVQYLPQMSDHHVGRQKNSYDGRTTSNYETNLFSS